MKFHTTRNQFMPSVLAGLLAVLLATSVQAEPTGFSWLQGSWCMANESQLIEEVWLSDVGGNLIGMSRTVAGDKVVSFEFMRIETTAGETRLIAQPGGRSGTVFTASQVSGKQLVVESPEHDFPRKITYQREGDVLNASISGPGAAGQEQSFSFTYELCPGSPQ